MRQTLPEVSEETLRLQTYIESIPAGMELSFEKIAYDTGLEMTQKNKNHLRTACRRANREYASIYGYGIRLADPGSVMPILTHRLVKIDRTVKRSEQTHKNLQTQFFDDLKDQEKKDILFIGACFGAIRAAAENGRMLYSREAVKQLPPGPSIRLEG
jgi:hypothetical protein